MKLYLVRHAHAMPANGGGDAVRPLSERGRMEIARLSSLLRVTRAFQPDQVWHSPLVRAAETAAGLVEKLGLDALRVETPGLQPDDAPGALAERLAEHPPTIAIALVGHEPQLGALATLLVRGRPDSVGFDFKPAAVLCLERAVESHKRTELLRWRVLWHLAPELWPPVLGPQTPPGPYPGNA